MFSDRYLIFLLLFCFSYSFPHASRAADPFRAERVITVFEDGTTSMKEIQYRVRKNGRLNVIELRIDKGYVGAGLTLICSGENERLLSSSPLHAVDEGGVEVYRFGLADSLMKWSRVEIYTKQKQRYVLRVKAPGGNKNPIPK